MQTTNLDGIFTTETRQLFSLWICHTKRRHMWQDMRKGTISHIFWIFILKCL